MAIDGKKVLYLGDDSAYFKVLAAEFQRLYPAIKLEQLAEHTPERIQGLIIKVMALNPALVFVDYSKYTDDYVHLSRLLVRTTTMRPFPVVGLHDYLSPPEQMKESFLSGLNINHIKSAETFDVVFDAVSLISPGQAKEHGFATAKIAKELTLAHLCKIGFVAGDLVHFETNLNLSQGGEFRLKHHWVQKKLIPSTLVRVKNSSQSLVFYHFKYAVDAQFVWVDPVVKVEGDDPQRIKELEGERDHAVVKAKKAMHAWLEDNTDRSQQKTVRVLVVDREFTFYQNLARTDKYGYAIRCQPFIKDISLEIDGQRPQVIAFSLDVPKEGVTLEAPLNDMAMLQSIILFVKQNFPKDPPFFVVFNSTAASKELQASYQYPQIMAYSGPVGPEVLLKMASVFDKKLKDAVAKQGMEIPEPKVFIKKTSPMSIGEIEEVINLVQISETDLVFTCNRALPVGTVLRLEEPFAGYITVAEHPQLGKAPAYYALVNGVGEIEKKTLRRFVNSIFFKDLDAAKLTELENFQMLNKGKWQDILTQQKAQLEAEEKAKAEEEARKAAEEEAAKNATQAAPPEEQS
jgi:hypothetical protein